MKNIPHNKPTIGGAEVKAAARALKSGWLAEGREVATFETELSAYLGLKTKQAVAFSSGTAAMFVALKTLGLKADDEVILPTYSCASLLNAIFLAQAKPIPVDIEPDSLALSLEKTREKINPRTKAIIVVHPFGQPAPIHKFLTLGLPVIEDAAMALGSRINNRPVGALGTIGVFSFYASKTITTGYGGMIVSRQKKYLKAAADYRLDDQRKKYQPRFNFHLSDIQAAIGREQLKKLPAFLAKRQKIAQAYYSALSPDVVWPPQNQANLAPNFQRFLIRHSSPTKLQQKLKKGGIQTIVPIQTWELLHRCLNLNPAEFPVSEKIARTTLSLPIHPSLTANEIKKICQTL
jgi:perosamine synthetase